MEVSALRYSGGIGLHGQSPLLRLQSDERLISLIRRGNAGAFEVLVARYQPRLLAFCRHLLGSREDAEDVLQEVLAAAFNAILADDRPINVRPWLYRIARNRSLNHLRRIQAVGVDSMDVHLSDYGASTADKVHDREEFRLLMGDIEGLPETQRSALVLREMDALSYEQIADVMETTVPSVKSLLVRARVSLAEAAEARMLSCEEVRIELAEVAEGLQRRPGPLARRHLRSCKRCMAFRVELKNTNKALAALLPIGPLAVLRKLALTHLGHHAGAGSSATGAGAAGSTAAAAGGGMAVASSGGFLSAGLGAIATKAAAGLAAAALVTAGAVEVAQPPSHSSGKSASAAARGQDSPEFLPLPPHARASSHRSDAPPPVSDAPAVGVRDRATPAAGPSSGRTVRVNARVSRAAVKARPKTPLKTALKPGAKTGANRRRGTLSQSGRIQTGTDPTVVPSGAGAAASDSPSGSSSSPSNGSGSSGTSGSSGSPDPSAAGTGSGDPTAGCPSPVTDPGANGSASPSGC